MRRQDNGWGVLLFAGLLAAGCVRNPATGERNLTLISEEQEIVLGAQAAEEVRQSLGLVEDEALQRYVSDVGMKLAKVSERPELPWSFQVVDDATVNAFALPGGFIFVTRGLVTYLRNEAELSGVLAHEIGHVTARHQVQLITRQQLTQLGLGIGMILSPELAQIGQLASLGLNLLFLRYSRDFERQADALAVEYVHNTGYRESGLPEALTMLGQVAELEGVGRLPSWLSTHPNPDQRVERVNELMRKYDLDPATGVRDRDEYLARLQNLLFGEDPKNGFFRGQTFFHPALQFRITFPEGWRTQNLPQAVVGVSPKQDAAVQLTITNARSPDEAARQFVQMQNVRSGPFARTTVNSVPAVAANFQAAEGDMQVEGTIAFLEHQGRTFQLLGFTVLGRLAAYQQSLEKSLNTFGPADPADLDVQPARLEVVTVEHEMTLEQFNERFPSSIGLDRLALINGFAPRQTIPAGTAMKRVVGPER